MREAIHATSAAMVRQHALFWDCDCRSSSLISGPMRSLWARVQLSAVEQKNEAFPANKVATSETQFAALWNPSFRCFEAVVRGWMSGHQCVWHDVVAGEEPRQSTTCGNAITKPLAATVLHVGTAPASPLWAFLPFMSHFPSDSVMQWTSAVELSPS